jgi:hypothetical protein
MAFIDDFKARFPEFETAIVDQYLPILEQVWPCYTGWAYEGCGEEIVLNLVAHLLVAETSAGTDPLIQITSQSVGSVSQSFAVDASVGERTTWLLSTKYGARYSLLTRHRQGGVFV